MRTELEAQKGTCSIRIVGTVSKQPCRLAVVLLNMRAIIVPVIALHLALKDPVLDRVISSLKSPRKAMHEMEIDTVDEVCVVVA